MNFRMNVKGARAREENDLGERWSEVKSKKTSEWERNKSEETSFQHFLSNSIFTPPHLCAIFREWTYNLSGRTGLARLSRSVVGVPGDLGTEGWIDVIGLPSAGSSLSDVGEGAICSRRWVTELQTAPNKCKLHP